MYAKGNATSIGQGIEDCFDSGTTRNGFLPSSKSNFYTDNFHVTLWLRDAVEINPNYTQQEGKGVNLSYTTMVNNQWLPLCVLVLLMVLFLYTTHRSPWVLAVFQPIVAKIC